MPAIVKSIAIIAHSYACNYIKCSTMVVKIVVVKYKSGQILGVDVLVDGVINPSKAKLLL